MSSIEQLREQLLADERGPNVSGSIYKNSGYVLAMIAALMVAGCRGGAQPKQEMEPQHRQQSNEPPMLADRMPLPGDGFRGMPDDQELPGTIDPERVLGEADLINLINKLVLKDHEDIPNEGTFQWMETIDISLRAMGLDEYVGCFDEGVANNDRKELQRKANEVIVAIMRKNRLIAAIQNEMASAPTLN